MENFKNYWHLIILFILTLIFCLSIFLQIVFKVEIKDGLLISISFISIFATFFGACLGAKISGDNALELQKREMKQNYFKKNYTMLISLDKKNLNNVKNDLKKYNDKLLKNEEQPYGTFSKLYESLNEIEKIKNDVEFTDSYTKAKFDMASDYITDIKIKNEMIKLIEIVENGGNRRDKEQATKDLNKVKEDLHTIVKKIQKSLEDVPLVDINEKFEL
ncbi:hypothetical protein [Staphylococcus aureus]|uniref:hypothetical protein n=1 Tax=Staphylococcus aureus TaxID=1280 RepID=UPI0004B5BC19|nr:hypothetical protein [Staphylococcus aureus]HEA6159841.1 hypothetical protein [Staphylococcus aureus]